MAVRVCRARVPCACSCVRDARLSLIKGEELHGACCLTITIKQLLQLGPSPPGNQHYTAQAA